MTIEAKIVADSISSEGARLTTFQLRYPRFIHAELMTHRVFSRNASSSRAIPVERMIEDLRRDPAMPIYWGSNQKGMQAGSELGGDDLAGCKALWLHSMENAIHTAESLLHRGLHKQIANRILEPWAHINVVVTATEWANFFALRCHEDAQPEIKKLADHMRVSMALSTPVTMAHGAWHLPYIQEQENELHIDDLKKISVARCARVSYLTHDGRQTSVEEDIKLYDRLVGSQPLHASPAEHQGTPDLMTNDDGEFNFPDWENPELQGNFTGWIQFRKTLPGEFTQG